MSRHYYFCTLILLFSGCIAVFHRNEFKRGIEFYNKGNFSEATAHFNVYYYKHPASETTLYYLYDCYQKLNQPEQGIQVLQALAKLGSNDENVYLNLFRYYHGHAQYDEMYQLMINLKPQVKQTLDKKYILNRRSFAEIISGGLGKAGNTNPVLFAIKQGYLELMPDGKFYDNDPMTNANLIISLDRLVAPIYPKKFFPTKNISNHSFLYLPYVRLVELGILDFNPDLNPDGNATISMATSAIANLKKQGFIGVR